MRGPLRLVAVQPAEPEPLALGGEREGTRGSVKCRIRTGVPFSLIRVRLAKRRRELAGGTSAVNFPSRRRTAALASSTTTLVPTTAAPARSISARAAVNWLPVSIQSSDQDARVPRQRARLEAEHAGLALVVGRGQRREQLAGEVAGCLADRDEPRGERRGGSTAEHEAAGFDLRRHG